MLDPKSQSRLGWGYPRNRNITEVTMTMLSLARRLAALLALAFALASPALADQSTLCLPTSGTLTGLTAITDINSAFKALVTSNSGSSAPTNDCTGAAIKGQLWLDTSVTPNVWKLYDGTGWEPLGVTDGTNHIFRTPTAVGLNSIASAATTDLWSLPDGYLTITGTTTITKLAGSSATGIKFFTIASAGLTLTHNGTQLILPGATSIVSQAGDKGIAVALGGGNVAVIAYTRADGTSLSANSTIATNLVLSGDITPTALASNTNNWAPTGLATASTLRISASSAVNLTGIAAQSNGTWLLLQNIGSNAITLSDSSTSSSAANRFNFGADYLLSPLGSIIIRYDGTTSRWLAASAVRPIATQLQATTGADNTTLMTPLRTAQAVAAENAASASGLKSATTVVDCSAAAAPSAGQVATATSSTACDWQTPSAGSVLLGSTTPSPGTTNTITTTWSGTYRFIYIELDGMKCGNTARLTLATSVNSGSSWGTAVNISASSGGFGDSLYGVARIDGAGLVGSGFGDGKWVQPLTTFGGGPYSTLTAVAATTSGALNGAQVKCSSGNYDAGTARFYGFK